ncbi:MAG: hypothetical protein A2Y67_02245 [Candidatus Buchananbacteria bacterium RBG_13_39_9]|uniref:DUF2079 domain-containing protein n=1 Tax=Candidatus Buchananbacteria bacterium RBG_13_39_9 TaxID=1797531 RepID=A0A1G1XNN5_9BACT|nr:MAG: hypothetical protein A2Y67_02245 [Candidatus Buchananbacteria bacterium RBG_13_39_9]
MPVFSKNLTWPKLNRLLWCLLAFYFFLVLAIGFFKYFTFAYNAFDLAIFNQVFYNTSFSRLYQFTIHPTSYLGDHFELILLLLTPFYSLCRSPLTLIIIQALFLGLSAIPLFLIAKKHLAPLAALLILLLYLFNPVPYNIAIFEFHILALAPFFLLWAFYFYDQKKFRTFLIFCLASCAVREDVCLAVFCFGLIALFERRKIKWILSPMILSALYFFASLKLISHFSSAATYKFLVYYYWLGQTPWEIFLNIFLKFPQVVQRFFTVYNLELILGFLLVFLFLPLLRPKYLLLALAAYLQIFLGFMGGELILQTHYATLFLPGCAIASIFALKYLSQQPRLINWYKKSPEIINIVLACSLIYIFLTLGPLPEFIKKIAATDYQEVQNKWQFVRQIPAGASVVTTYDLIPALSSRPKLYALNYLFLGRQQYNAGDYKIPADTQFLLFNLDDFLTFNLQYEKKESQYYYQGSQNLRQLLTANNYQLIKVWQNLALWQQNAQPTDYQLYKTFETLPAINNHRSKDLNDNLKFLGYDQQADYFTLYFQAKNKMQKNYFLQLDDKIYCLGHGLYPTGDWQEKQIVAMNFYNLPLPKNLQIIDLAGGLGLDGLGSSKNSYDKFDQLAEFNLD